MKVLGWCGIHYPEAFDHISVMVQTGIDEITVHVNNPSSTAWVVSDNEIRKQAIKLASK